MAGNANSGRRKAPRAVRVAKGTRKYDKKTDTFIERDSHGSIIEDSLVVTGEVTAPDNLKTDFEIKLWHRITTTTLKDVLCPLDETQLANWIKQVRILNRLFEELDESELKVAGSKGQPRISDIVATIQSQQRTVNELGSKLGLDPVARNNITMPDKPNSDDVW